MNEDYTFGIEEEYFIVDAVTQAVTRKSTTAFLIALKKAIGPAVTREMLQAQLEVMTKPRLAMADARDELRQLRRTVGEIAAKHDLSFFAAGTHPIATRRPPVATPAARYDALMHDFQMLGERNLLCGLHVHVQVPDPDARVDLMRRIQPFVPMFIALATSSPFWSSRRTGLMGYRLAAYDELPRTGLPPLFPDRESFDSYVAALVEARIMPDASYVWWAIRPSRKLPTLELRAPDSCTRLEDAVAIAALYRALVRHIVRNPGVNADFGPVDQAITDENKWRAQRYGIHGSFVDRMTQRAVPVGEALDALLATLEADIDVLGAADEIAHLRKILEIGTSADMQLKVYLEAEGRTRSRTKALRAVTGWLAETTLQ
jgi:carboxylate-amine ligase